MRLKELQLFFRKYPPTNIIIIMIIRYSSYYKFLI
jgi:hypothetical protein